MWIYGEVKIPISEIRSAADLSGNELGTNLSLFLLTINRIKGKVKGRGSLPLKTSNLIDPSGVIWGKSLFHQSFNQGRALLKYSSIGFIHSYIIPRHKDMNLIPLSLPNE